MYFLSKNFLGKFLNSICTIQLWRTLCFALFITPVMMFVLGLLFESRVVAIGAGQSKAFIPGDGGLAIALAMAANGVRDGLSVFSRKLASRSWWPWATAIVSIAIALTMRFVIDAPNYPNVRSTMSPTKIWHDSMCYGVLLWMILSTAIPVLLGGKTKWKVGILSGVAVWLGGIIFDLFVGGLFGHANSAEVQHPSNWVPLSDNPLIIVAMIIVTIAFYFGISRLLLKKK